MSRIAIIDTNKCKPKKCNQECKNYCPVVRMGKLCIEVSPSSKIAIISEELCIGCGICTKKCPFNAISIINIDILKKIEHHIIHRYGQNSFKLYRLPIPRMNQILGIIGSNGMGKSTVLKILGNKLKPNLGNYTIESGVKCKASSPKILSEGLNIFLKSLDVTFRRDPNNFRPRINKMDSIKDKEQKSIGKYYYVD